MALTKDLGKAAALGAVGFWAFELIVALVVTGVAHGTRRQRKPRGFPYLEPTSVTVAGNRLTVYTYGVYLYEDMLAAIDQATDHVYLESFIWKNDELGERFMAAISRAAARGVRVAVVYDVFGNLVVPSTFFRFPPGVVVHPYPLLGGGLTFWRPRNSGRDHRKILVVDGKVAFTGGYNIGSLYADRWRDSHLRIEGDFAAELEDAFVENWRSSPGAPRPQLPLPPARSWTPELRLHRNMPRLFTYPIRNVYLDAINRAEHRIWLTTAYLIPDDDLISALAAAVERGVDVRIICPAQSNHVLADWLSRRYLETMLLHGIRLFLYQGAMIHSKTAVIDSTWSTIGTANLDAVSLAGNYEVNVEIFSPELAQVMERVFEADLTNCRELDLTSWRCRPWYQKLSEALLTPVRSLL